jgi:hypothetical protein
MKRGIKDEFLDDMAKLHKKIADITLVDGTKISGEDLRLEHQKYGKGGRITSLDLLEARQFFGEDDWKKLSKEDRINSAKYLKRTGRIGYKKGGKITQPIPEPMESAEFYSAMQYDKGGDVLMEIDTHKAVKHGDKIKIYRKELEFDSNYDVIGEKLIYLYSIPIENEDDLLPIFEEFEETNRYLVDEANREMMAKGGIMADGGMMSKGGATKKIEVIVFNDKKVEYTNYDINEILDDNYLYSSDNLPKWLIAVRNKGNKNFPKNKEEVVSLLKKIVSTNEDVLIDVDSNKPAYLNKIVIGREQIMADGGELTQAQIDKMRLSANSYRILSPTQAREKKKLDRALIKEENKKIPKNEMKHIEAYIKNEDLLYKDFYEERMKKMADGGRVRSQYIVTYDDGDDISKVWVYANNEQDAKEQALEEYSDIKEIISVEKMMADGGTTEGKWFVVSAKEDKVVSSAFDSEEKAKKAMYELYEKNKDFSLATRKMADGGMMAYGGKIAVRNEDIDEASLSGMMKRYAVEIQDEESGDVLDYEYFDSEEEANKFISTYKKNQKILAELYNRRTKMADGGKITDKEVADSNVEMLHSNIKSIKHHADELEEAIKDKSEIEGWVLAKADRAATAMSDITHYLDGRKMGNGGMVAGYYYKDKNGENLRYVGPDSKDVNIGLFKNGDKYIQKPYNDFEQEPKSNKLFGWFGNGGYMPKGTNRKLTIAEKAEEMVGRNTWNELDSATKEGVIEDLISDGALSVTMESGGILSSNDWDKASTDEKIYAIKKAGYSNNMASEMSILPYEQLPMWVREDFKKGAIVIGGYHIHKNRLSSPVPLKMGKFLVFNGDEEVVFSAETLEEAKDWATEEARLDKEESQDYEMVSDCCGAPQGQITDLCPECREHCGWEKMYYAEGGVTEAVRFKVIYKIKDLEPKEKVFDNAENAEFFLETIKEDEDIESANLVEVKPEKKSKPTNLFAAAKPATKTSSSKKSIEDVVVTGIADEIAQYDRLKAIIKNATNEKDQIGDRLKTIGVEKFLELYELRRRNPDTFNLSDEDNKIMFYVMDKYKNVEPEKVEMLENYPGLLETVTTYKFNPQLLDKTGEIVSRLIMESNELTDDEKANLIIAETKVGIKTGSIDRLLDYDNPSLIFTLIEPVIALK